MRRLDINYQLTTSSGPFVLFQATLPLLRASSSPKFVLLGSPVGSIAGMEQRPVPMGGYGASKAMAHYLVRKIHFENPDLIAFAVDPGYVVPFPPLLWLADTNLLPLSPYLSFPTFCVWGARFWSSSSVFGIRLNGTLGLTTSSRFHLYSFVQTDSGNEGARIFGMAEAPVTVMDSVQYVVSTVSTPFPCASQVIMRKVILSISLLFFRLTPPQKRRHPAIFPVSVEETFYGSVPTC